MRCFWPLLHSLLQARARSMLGISSLGVSLLLTIPLVQFQDMRKLGREWRVYGGDFGGRRHSVLDQINRSNVGKLEVAWIFRTGDMQRKPATTIQCNPIVVDGITYLTSPALKVIALRAATGEKIWQFDPFQSERSQGTNRGVTYWEHGGDRRIFFTAGAFLYALEARTGTPIQSFGKAGKVDLRDGLDREAFFLSVVATTPGIVYKNLLIMGSVVGEGPSPSAPGHV